MPAAALVMILSWREIGRARRIALVIDDLETVLLDFLAGAVGGALSELGVGGLPFSTMGSPRAYARVILTARTRASLELDEGCPTFRRRFLHLSLGGRTRARGWDAAMSR